MTAESGDIFQLLTCDYDSQSEYLLLTERILEEDGEAVWEFHGMDTNRKGWEYEDILFDPQIYERLA